MLHVREDRPLGRINAHRHNRKILPDLQWQFFCAAQEAIEHLRAQHRELVIHERQDDGLLSKEFLQCHRVAVLVAKSEIKGNVAAEVLIQSDVAQQRRAQARSLHRSVVQLSVCGADVKKAPKKPECENR